MAKILIIDDSKTIVKTLETLLKTRGHQVFTAEDGEKGLTIAKQETPELILLDIMLPKLNGYEVCNMLKMDGAYSHIKILMFTAKTGGESKTLSIETGADAFITKESDPDAILDRIEKMLGA